MKLAVIGQYRQMLLFFSSRIADVVAADRLLGKYFEANALNAAWRTREAAVNDFFCQPHRFKDLGALVTLQGRDPHFGHYLKHAFGDTLAIAGNNLFIGP